MPEDKRKQFQDGYIKKSFLNKLHREFIYLKELFENTVVYFDPIKFLQLL